MSVWKPSGYGQGLYYRILPTASYSSFRQAWYTQNLQISIPVTIAAAFVIFIIAYLIFSGKYLSRAFAHRLLILRLRTAIRSCCMGSERRNFPSKAAGRQRLQSWPNLPPGATMVQVQPGGPPSYMYGPKYVRLITFLSDEMLTIQRSSACRLTVEWGQMARGTGMYPLHLTIGRRGALVAPRHNRSDRNHHSIAMTVLTGHVVSQYQAFDIYR